MPDKVRSISGLPAVARMGVRRMRAQLDEQCVIHANAQFWDQILAVAFRHTNGDLMVRVWEQECAQGC
jgi:hypothetical protein